MLRESHFSLNRFSSVHVMKLPDFLPAPTVSPQPPDSFLWRSSVVPSINSRQVKVCHHPFLSDISSRSRALEYMCDSARDSSQACFAILAGCAVLIHPGTDVDMALHAYQQAYTHPEVESEHILKLMGFPESYTHGLDSAQESAAIFSHIRRSSPSYNLRTDHIPELIPLVNRLVKFAHKVLDAQVERQKRSEVNNFFELEALEYIEEKKVTYVWLMSFYHRLAVYLSLQNMPDSEVLLTWKKASWIDPDDFIKNAPSLFLSYISCYPELIGVPIEDGELGLIGLNTLTKGGFCVMGLIGDMTYVHEAFMDAVDFASHDHGHFDIFKGIMKRHSSSWKESLHELREIHSLAQRCDFETRLALEWYIYMASRENPRSMTYKGQQKLDHVFGANLLIDKMQTSDDLQKTLPPTLRKEEMPFYKRYLSTLCQRALERGGILL